MLIAQGATLGNVRIKFSRAMHKMNLGPRCLARKHECLWSRDGYAPKNEKIDVTLAVARFATTNPLRWVETQLQTESQARAITHMGCVNKKRSPPL